MKDSALSDSKLAPWPFYADDEVAAVTAVLRSGRVNYRTGNIGETFEADYAAHCGVKFGVAVANGTLALELALQGLGIGPGDDVVVPARTFVGTAAAVIARGARPVLADVDPASQNLTADTVAAALTPATKAVIPVHLNGWPVDMAPLMALAAQRNFKVIEDCAQAHGAKDRGRPVGGIGHIGCFSFCQDKIITTGGEGGMVVTNDEAAYRRMWAYRDHGWDYVKANTPDTGAGFRWLVEDFGTNWRLTESQSAIGRIQLAKLAGWIERRRANARVLDAALRDAASVRAISVPAQSHHSYYKYVFQVEPAALKNSWSRDRITTALNDRGIPARVGGCPNIGQEAAFARHKIAVRALTHADALGERTIALPVHPTLTDGNMAYIAETLAAVMKDAAR